MSFTVIDNKTGEYPDLWKIATEEEWAKGLMYCDMEGFALLEDGTLILLDECGRFEYCPSDRFTVVPDTNVGHKSEWISVDERLPEEKTRVLGYSRLLDEICCYDIAKDTTEIQWWTEDNGWYRASELNITHWMPLPETPKMKGGAE